MFEGGPADGACPCASGRLCRDYCLKLPGVLLPHPIVRIDASLPTAVAVGIPHELQEYVTTN
jgi:hypothetical protein